MAMNIKNYVSQLTFNYLTFFLLLVISYFREFSNLFSVSSEVILLNIETE